MESAIAPRQTPEQQELDKELAELAALETELAQRELDLATLQAELHAFEREYLRVVGIRYTELDRVEAQIAEYMAYLESSRDFKPSESLKETGFEFIYIYPKNCGSLKMPLDYGAKPTHIAAIASEIARSVSIG